MEGNVAEKFSQKSIEDFTRELSGKAAVPGGGGVAALAGSLAAALGCMVANLTIGKERYKNVQAEALAARQELLTISADLLALIDRDAEAFAPLAEAYRLPSGTEDERMQKNYAMQYALVDAAMVPLEIMRVCGRSIDFLDILSRIGSKLALSDAACGAELAKAAMRTAMLNVLVNTNLMDDADAAARIEAEAMAMADEYTPKADEIYTRVKASMERS